MPSTIPDGHVAVIRELEPERSQKNLYGTGITPHYANNGRVCKITFDSSIYDQTRALEWLDRHGYNPVDFFADGDGYQYYAEQPRENEAVVEIPIDHPRTLSIPWSEAGGKIVNYPDGSLRVTGVKMLAAGTWTDSARKTPLNYSPEVLQRSATNWIDNSMWARHLGGVPRRIGEKVGTIEKQRFEDGAVVADIFYHALSQDSRDTIAMINGGQANFVSVEHAGKERWNVGKKQYEAEDIIFTGAATVNKGACQVCKIRENADGKTSADVTKDAGSDVKAFVPGNPSGYGKADETEPWSAPGLADFTDKSWADLTDAEKRKIASSFAYAGGLSTFSDLKLPHHRPNGDVVWRGVATAMAVMRGSRGGVDVPSDMRDAITNHLAAHYKDFDKTVPGRENETISESESYESIGRKISDAIRDKFNSGKTEWYPYIRYTFQDSVIYQFDGKMYRVPYSIGVDGSISLGEQTEVEEQFSDKELEMAEIAELEKLIKDQGELIRSLQESVKTLTETKPEEKAKELEARVTALEKDPHTKSASGDTGTVELEAPPFILSRGRDGSLSIVGVE